MTSFNEETSDQQNDSTLIKRLCKEKNGFTKSPYMFEKS